MHGRNLGHRRITKVHETESYDYPTQIAEQFGEFSNSVQAGWSSFANTNLKVRPGAARTCLGGGAHVQLVTSAQNSNLPIPIPAQKHAAPIPPKTLPHALSRAAKQGAATLAAADAGVSVGVGARLGTALTAYGGAMERVGDARLSQDQMIQDKFLTPWQATLASSISLAMKARANVKTARLELDTARATWVSRPGALGTPD